MKENDHLGYLIAQGITQLQSFTTKASLLYKVD